MLKLELFVYHFLCIFMNAKIYLSVSLYTLECTLKHFIFSRAYCLYICQNVYFAQEL